MIRIIIFFILIIFLANSGALADTPVDAREDTREEERGDELLRARIYLGLGQNWRAMNIYRQLLKKDPHNQQNWLGYIESLINMQRYESALLQTGKFLLKYKGHEQATRFLALILQEMRYAESSLPIYEQLIQVNPLESNLWSAYAYALIDNGQWDKGLYYFCKVLEVEPENRQALRMVHSILGQKSPIFMGGYRIQSTEVERLSKVFAHQQVYLSNQSRLSFHLDWITADRQAVRDDPRLAETIIDLRTRLDYSRGNLTTWLASGFFRGVGDGIPLMAGFDYRLKENLIVKGDLQMLRPWYDPVQAVPYQSTYNRGSLSLETYFAQSWGFYFNLSQWYYSIYSGQDYGSRQIISAIVSRRLADRPEIYLSASAVTSWFAYADKYQDSDTRPIHMLDREMVLVASLRFKHWLTDHISLTLATEGRRDIVRALFSWYILSGLGVRIGKWVEADIVYDRSSEARTVLGGTLQSFTANIKVTF